MKAKLIIDMPESCSDCEFQNIGMGDGSVEICDREDRACEVTGDYMRPTWCPLQEVDDDN